jgi:hypothetical protein
VKELRGGAAALVGVARVHDAGLPGGSALRGDHKGTHLRVRSCIHVHPCLASMHRGVAGACDEAAHDLEVSLERKKACQRQTTVSVRQSYRTQFTTIYGYKFPSFSRF